MRTINSYLKYDGGSIEQGVLYTSTSTFMFSGKVEFRIFGSARFNNINIKDTTIKTDTKDSKLTLSKDSAVVFYKTPHLVKTHPEYLPVEDIPEYMDDATASIAAMVEDILRRKGLAGASEGDSPSINLDDDEWIEDDDDSLVTEISTLTLVDSNEKDLTKTLQQDIVEPQLNEEETNDDEEGLHIDNERVDRVDDLQGKVEEGAVTSQDQDVPAAQSS